MKRLVSLIGMALLFTTSISAQDIITKKNGEDIKARVTEVSSTEITYRLFEEPNGPTYKVKTSDLLMIRYESGRNEVFNTKPSAAQAVANTAYANREPVENLAPGMKYKELKNLYDPKDYTPSSADRYSPALSGVASFLIPGLGQMIDGELGRGFGYLGGTIGCTVAGTILSSIGAAAAVQSGNEAIAIGTSIGSIVFILGAAAFDIAAIVDGIRVAKVKNMYEQDLKNNYAVQFNFYPSFDCTPIAGSYKPTAGVTLAMTF